MDSYPHVIEMRRRVLGWFAGMQATERGFGVHANSAYHRQSGMAGMYLPGTYNATACLFLLGAYDAIRPSDAASLAEFLNRFQLPDGVYRIPEMRQAEIYYPDFEYIDLHTSNYTLGALALLGRRPARPLAFMRRYDTSEKLSAWLAARQMAEPWTEGNYIVNLASFYAYLLEKGEASYGALLEQLFDWHQAHQEPESGYWYDPQTRDLTSAMAGAAHNLHLYYYLNRSVPRFQRIVDHCLAILDGVSSACLDIDVVDILANLYEYGYRQPDIEVYLRRKLDLLLGLQNPDGGFPDILQGTRLFDGWERYQEPQSLSNSFATWFRCAAIGMICHVLYPQQRGEWHFRNTLGMGYFRPRPPAGGTANLAPAPGAGLRPSKSGPAVSPETGRTATGSTATGRPQTAVASQPPAYGRDAGVLRRRIQEKLSALPPARLAGAAGFYQLELAGPQGGSLLIIISGASADVQPGPDRRAQVVLSASSETLNRLLDGRLNTTVAYMTKKLKVRGDLALALKLEALLR